MPYCPNCKFEYHAGMLVCPDCDIPLVDRLIGSHAGAAIMPDDGWVGVCSLSSNAMSRLVKGALDSSNIPSVIAPAVFETLENDVQFTAGKIIGSVGKTTTVLVPREFQEEACIILEAVLGDEYIGDDAR